MAACVSTVSGDSEGAVEEDYTYLLLRVSLSVYHLQAGRS